LDGEPLGPLHCGNGDFIGDGLAGLADLPMPLPLLDDLPEAERDQDAEHDDSDLAGERAPAVHRFWQVDMHRDAPGGATLAQVPTAATVAAVTRSAACRTNEKARRDGRAFLARRGLVQRSLSLSLSDSPMLSRASSFALPQAFCSLPSAWSALPSSFIFSSPNSLPAPSFSSPPICLALPSVRSWSMPVAVSSWVSWSFM